jgi:hypothetical protein
MRKLATLLTAVAAVAAAALPALPAAAAAAPTRTVKAHGGAPVAVGDLLSSSLTPGSNLSLLTAAGGGGVGLICAQSVWQAPTLANPPVGGAAVLQITSYTISSCVDTAPGVTGVLGVTTANLPVMLRVTGVGAFPIQIIPGPGPGPLRIVASLNTAGGAVGCTWQSVPATNGTTGLGALPWVFNSQPFTLIAGPLPFCGAPNDFFTAAYSPVIDVTAGGANVFVN